MIGKSMSWTVPAQDRGRRGVAKRVLGRVRVGDRSGSGGPPATGAPWTAAGAAPATVTAPFMPASAWPGIEHRKVEPGGRDGDHAGRRLAGLGDELGAVGERDVVERRAGVLEGDVVRPGGGDRDRRPA